MSDEKFYNFSDLSDSDLSALDAKKTSNQEINDNFEFDDLAFDEKFLDDINALDEEKSEIEEKTYKLKQTINHSTSGSTFNFDFAMDQIYLKPLEEIRNDKEAAEKFFDFLSKGNVGVKKSDVTREYEKMEMNKMISKRLIELNSMLRDNQKIRAHKKTETDNRIRKEDKANYYSKKGKKYAHLDLKPKSLHGSFRVLWNHAEQSDPTIFGEGKLKKIIDNIEFRHKNKIFYLLGDFDKKSREWKAITTKNIFYFQNQNLTVLPFFYYAFRCQESFKINHPDMALTEIVFHEVKEFVSMDQKTIGEISPNLGYDLNTCKLFESFYHIMPAPFSDYLWKDIVNFQIDSLLKKNKAYLPDPGDDNVFQTLKRKYAYDVKLFNHQANSQKKLSSIFFEDIIKNLGFNQCVEISKNKQIKLYFFFQEINSIIYNWIPCKDRIMDLDPSQLCLYSNMFDLNGDQYIKKIFPLLFIKTSDKQYIKENLFSADFDIQRSPALKHIFDYLYACRNIPNFSAVSDNNRNSNTLNEDVIFTRIIALINSSEDFKIKNRIPKFDISLFGSILRKCVSRYPSVLDNIQKSQMFKDMDNLKVVKSYINESDRSSKNTCVDYKIFDNPNSRSRKSDNRIQLLSSISNLHDFTEEIDIIETDGENSVIVEKDFHYLIEMLEYGIFRIIKSFMQNGYKRDLKKGDEHMIPEPHPLTVNKDKYCVPSSFKLSAEQMIVNKKLDLYPINFCPGGPGTGKTTMLKISLQNVHPHKKMYITSCASAVMDVGYKKVCGRSCTAAKFITAHAFLCRFNVNKKKQNSNTNKYLTNAVYTLPDWYIERTKNTKKKREDYTEEENIKFDLETERSNKKYYCKSLDIAFDLCPAEAFKGGRIVIDETSLMSTSVFCTLMFIFGRCCGGDVTFALAGDGDQLPSIEKGSLHDNLEMCMQKMCTKFNMNHRTIAQKKRSLLFSNAYAIDNKSPSMMQYDRIFHPNREVMDTLSKIITDYSDYSKYDHIRARNYKKDWEQFLPSNLLLGKTSGDQQSTTMDDYINPNRRRRRGFLERIRNSEKNVAKKKTPSSSSSSVDKEGENRYTKPLFNIFNSSVGGINPNSTKDIEYDFIEIPGPSFIQNNQIKDCLIPVFSFMLSRPDLLSHWMKYGETKDVQIICRTNEDRMIISEILTLLCHSDRSKNDFSKIVTVADEPETEEKDKNSIEIYSGTTRSTFQTYNPGSASCEGNMNVIYSGSKVIYDKNDYEMRLFNNVIYLAIVQHVALPPKFIKNKNGVNMSIEKFAVAESENCEMSQLIKKTNGKDKTDTTVESTSSDVSENKSKSIMEEFYKYKQAKVIPGKDYVESTLVNIAPNPMTRSRANVGKRILLIPISNMDKINRNCKDKDEIVSVPFTSNHYQHLKHASAITCMSSQGCEFKTVIVVIPYYCKFTTRQLLKVATSRARERVIIISRRAIIDRIMTNDAPSRTTYFGKYISHKLGHLISSLPDYEYSSVVRKKIDEENAQIIERMNMIKKSNSIIEDNVNLLDYQKENSGSIDLLDTRSTKKSKRRNFLEKNKSMWNKSQTSNIIEKKEPIIPKIPQKEPEIITNKNVAPVQNVVRRKRKRRINAILKRK